MFKDLSNKKIVLVGGTTGIGLAVAKAASQQNANIVIASRSLEKLDLAKAAIGGNVEAYPVDVTDESSIKTLFEQVGQFDHLVTTPGNPIAFEPFIDADLGCVTSQFTVKFWGQYLCARYGAKQINPQGSITFMSGGGRRNKGNTTLASINGAIDALTTVLSVELAPIRVNVVQPGLIKSDVWNNYSEEERIKLYHTVGESLPVGRVGTPEEVAETYLYLLNSNFTTGATIIIDGGASQV